MPQGISLSFQCLVLSNYSLINFCTISSIGLDEKAIKGIVLVCSVPSSN